MPPEPIDRVLVGAAGSRNRINTPALLLDLDALDRNLRHMGHLARAHGRDLRPHVKTHKCSRLAARQIEAGAVGICCATLDEVEIMAAAGIPGLLLTSPVVSPEKIGRLVALARRSPDVMVVADDFANVAALSAAADGDVTLGVLVELEVGSRRTGTRSIQEAVSLAEAVYRSPGLRLAGVQAYAGNLQHVADAERRASACAEVAAVVRRTLSAFEAADLPVGLVTGSGTGSHAIDVADSPFTELQAGSYAVMDADYLAIEAAPGERWRFEPALLVQTAVISTRPDKAVVVDAGAKALPIDGAPPFVRGSRWGHARYEPAGDEHGRMVMAGKKPAIGDRIELVVSHCDPTIACFDRFHCVRGDVLVDLWPVDARGRL